MKKASSDLLLLDVNVLLALAWPNHQFHTATVRALSNQTRWATCALTQLGFIRLSANRAVVATAKSPQQSASLLGQLLEDPLHVYLDSLPEPVSEKCRTLFANILVHPQVTDAYLLQVAVANDATLGTFDRRLESIAKNAARVILLS